VKKLKRLRKSPARPKQPSDPVQIVVGLRNPGPDYQGTRHNVGAEVVTALLARVDETPARAPCGFGV
jgi:hypothetical protein